MIKLLKYHIKYDIIQYKADLIRFWQNTERSSNIISTKFTSIAYRKEDLTICGALWQ